MLNRRYIHRQKRPLQPPRPAGRRRKRRGRPFLAFLAITAVLFLFADFRLRPSIAQALRYQTRAAAVRILSEETLALLEPMELSYEDISRIHRDENGKITSIETDTVKMNLIKSRLEQGVTAALNSGEGQGISLPLGSLLGNEYLSGRGPAVTVRMIPTGALQAEFVSRFQSAGINQTSHRIVLNLTLDVTGMVPLHSAETTVTTNFVLVDTVIVGEVPEYYTNIAGGYSNELSSSVLDPLDVETRRNSGLT